MQNLSNEDINAAVRTADAIWAVCRSKRTDPEWEEKNVSDRISHLQSRGYNEYLAILGDKRKHITEAFGHLQGKGFSEFITKYAIPTRYMVMYNEYNSKAFSKYLVRLKTVGYGSKDDWIARQADYVKFLWRAYNPHAGAAEAAEVRRKAEETIKKEMDSFETDYDKAKVKAEERHKEAVAYSRQTLIELLRDRAKLSKIVRALETKPAEATVNEIVDEVEPVNEVQPVEIVEPAHEIAVAKQEAAPLTETQRKNAAHRKREKIKKALAAVPEVPAKTDEQIWAEERAAAKEKLREQRRVERIRTRERERENEKERMRRKYKTSIEDKPTKVMQDLFEEDDSEIEGLSDE